MLAIVGPGLLVAATGVGAGDLATAGIAGSKLGLAVLWAVAMGAFFKFVLNEGLARWQLATGQTILEGAILRPHRFVSPIISVAFLAYFLPWSFFTGTAMMAACGVTAGAILPVFDDPAQAKTVFGIAHSLIGVALVLVGGFKLFERLMAACVGVMFVTVIVTAAMLRPDLSGFLRGLLTPTIPQLEGEGLPWTIGLIGGVGGTLTILCYAYWMREEGRESVADLSICRIDLAVGYALTAMFGMGMIVIAQGMVVEGGGAGLVVRLAEQLGGALGPAAKWIFLVGAWAAVFSSLLGVWQAVPYLFADFIRIHQQRFGARSTEQNTPVNTRGPAYRGYLLALAILPMAGLFQQFSRIQLAYTVIGAMFIPALALVLLTLNSRSSWVGAANRSAWYTNAVLILAILFFVMAGVYDVRH